MAVLDVQKRRKNLCRHSFCVESLEQRALLTVVPLNPIANTFGSAAGGPTTVDLSGTFDDTDVTGTVIRFTTSLGNMDIELFDQTAPKTAQNFANYVANHLYDNTVFHRLVTNFILQGGGYSANATHIPEATPVKNEFSPNRPNLRGTISAVSLPSSVPGGGPDSATSEWLINLSDNPSNDTNGYAVFGHVINNTMTTVDAINALPVFDASSFSPVFSQLPVRNTPSGNPGANDFVFLNSANRIDETKLMTITATSDNPSIVSPSVSNGVLSLAYGATTGSARITVTATNSDGSSSSQTFVAGNNELTVQIGSGGVGSAINFVEADGGKGSVSLSKGGSGFVRFSGQGLAIVPGRHPGLSGTVTGISNITTIDTGVASTLTVTDKGGDGAIDVGGLSSDGPLKTLSIKPTRFTGTLVVGGTVKSAAFGSLSNAAVTFGGSPIDRISLGLTLGSANNTSFTSGMPIKSVKATEFLASGTPLALTAPAVTSVSTKGNFQEQLLTQSSIKSIKAGGSQKGDITGTALGSLSAASLDGGIFNISGGGNSIGKISVRGAITNTTIRAGGNISSIAAGSIAAARVYAGVNVPDEEFPPFLPADLSQFTASARIGSVKIASSTDGLSIAAATLGKLILGKVATDGPIPFGIAALTIDALSGGTADSELGPGTPFSFKKLDDQASFDALVAAQGIPLGNMEVHLF
jgi:peptidyl-prolyl cis-trans isomerase A (cyclophilin A)